MNDIWEKHISVLLNELINSIEINAKKHNIIVDSTLWMWWHFVSVSKKLFPWDIIIWFDTDIDNLKLAKLRIIDELKSSNIEFEIIESIKKQNKNKINIVFINANFWELKQSLKNLWINKISWIYYDLWVSSLHLDEPKRWFSFMNDWPLDMRLNKNLKLKASHIVNSYSVWELREIFLKYWEEPSSNKIANLIVEQRKKEKFKTTKDLADIIPGPIKVKARIFQAIRIETNNELEMLEKSINDAIKLLKSDGIIFIISFHSLEDRIVKHILRRETKDCICKDLFCSCKHKKSIKLLSKKPISPTKEEIKVNIRSRSAKARIWKKL